MAKLLFTVLLVLVSGAYCRNDNSTTVMPEPSSTTPTPPTPTPTTLPSIAPNFLYNFTEPGSPLICIRMNASLGLVVGYNNTNNQEKSVVLDIAEPATVSNASFCNQSVPNHDGIYATELTLVWGYNPSDPNINYTLTFYLKANYNKGKEQWNVTSVNATIPVEGNNDLPQPLHPLPEVTAGYGNLVESLDFTRSYFCNTSRSLEMTVFAGSPNYNVSLNISGFQIQAFGFSNTTTYEYGSAVRCSQDIKGSKIVPIIVGAALAGLVIIVLIAYIIGRYRSRKQNSYEALS